MRAAIVAVAVAAASTTGCTRSSSDEQAPAPTPDAAAEANEDEADGIDPRDQYALLDAIVAAKGELLRTDPAALPRVRSEWIDRRYRWEVALQPALCGTVGDCVVLPFDHATREEPITQGWLPRLDLSTDEREALRQRCAELRGCVVDLEGTLAQFELSTELPTSLTFRDVVVHTVRPAAEGESWTVSKRRKRLADQAAAAVAARQAREGLTSQQRRTSPGAGP